MKFPKRRDLSVILAHSQKLFSGSKAIPSVVNNSFSRLAVLGSYIQGKPSKSIHPEYWLWDMEDFYFLGIFLFIKSLFRPRVWITLRKFSCLDIDHTAFYLPRGLSIPISWYLDHLEKENPLFKLVRERKQGVFLDDLGWIDGLREASFLHSALKGIPFCVFYLIH